jgi:hypothetical protein
MCKLSFSQCLVIFSTSVCRDEIYHTFNKEICENIFTVAIWPFLCSFSSYPADGSVIFLPPLCRGRISERTSWV